MLGAVGADSKAKANCNISIVDPGASLNLGVRVVGIGFSDN